MFFVGALCSMAKADWALLLALAWSQHPIHFLQIRHCRIPAGTQVVFGSVRRTRRARQWAASFFHAAEPVTVTMENVEG